MLELPAASFAPCWFVLVMSKAPAASENVPSVWPLATDTVPDVEKVMGASCALRAGTLNVTGLEPVNEPPDSDQSRLTLNVPLPAWAPVTLMLIVIEALPPGATVTLPVGA